MKGRGTKARRRLQGLCPACGGPPATGRVQCARCTDRDRKRHSPAKRNAGRKALRREVLAYYGGACACCGEDNPGFLQIDHIADNGAAHRREIKKRGGHEFYQWLKSNGFPPGFQVMCANCNFCKGKYGQCVHVRLNDADLRSFNMLAQNLAASPRQSHWAWGTRYVPDAAREEVGKRLDKLQRQFLQLGRQDTELEVECFGPILAEFRFLQRSGVRFDRALTILMDKLGEQAFGSPDDGDEDNDDPHDGMADMTDAQAGGYAVSE